MAAALFSSGMSRFILKFFIVFPLVNLSLRICGSRIISLPRLPPGGLLFNLPEWTKVSPHADWFFLTMCLPTTPNMAASLPPFYFRFRRWGLSPFFLSSTALASLFFCPPASNGVFSQFLPRKVFLISDLKSIHPTFS